MADGLRSWKQDSNNIRTYFLYDGVDPVLELDSGGNVSALNSFGANGLISRNTPTSGSTFYSFDEKGNVAQRLDGSGSALSTHQFQAFGQAVAGSDPNPDPFGYKGQEGYYTDNETGLIYCTFRYYDPSTGRWLTRDPIGMEGGINLYGYVTNNPVNLSDPLGLSGESLEEMATALLRRLFGGKGGTKKGTATLGNAACRNKSTMDSLTDGEDVGGMNDVLNGYQDRLKPAGKAAQKVFNTSVGVGIVGVVTHGAGSLPSGLRSASPGLRELYSGGSVSGKSIITIRDVLLRNGFTMTKARGRGYLFTNGIGEQVRVMYRNGGWDARIMNRGANYLDAFGNVAQGRGASHGIQVLNQ